MTLPPGFVALPIGKGCYCQRRSEHQQEDQKRTGNMLLPVIHRLGKTLGRRQVALERRTTTGDGHADTHHGE
jgi:hypothetical protein